MKVLVFGANGQLGQCLLPKLAGHDVVAATRAEIDLTDTQAIAPFITETQPDCVLNLSAYTAVDKAESEVELAYCINQHSVAAMAQACAALDRPLFHVSTDFVFSGNQSTPYTTDAPCQPIGAYGQSKFAGEQAIAQYHPGRSVIVRTAWLYSDVGANFLLSMLRLMRERDTLGIVCDQVGTPTSAYSLADTLVRFLDSGGNGVYHWTDAGVASWYDFAVAIYEEAQARDLVPSGVKINPIFTADYPTPAKRPAYSVLDKSRTYDDVQAPKVHWRAELRAVLDRLASQ
ncbi:MAG: dTDP-4-dehydrorhamnose reductase [Pseudomonadota bacterium]|nr:dTDP-4-dehydrorhamnose reductase [Pseudomonadota bacterium]